MSGKPCDAEMEYSQVPLIGSSEKLEKVLWLTNLAAPYRVPVWNRIGEHCELSVGLLESNSSLSTDIRANRGRDWLHSPEAGVHYVEIPTWKISRGEARYYFLRNFSPVKQIREADLIVFGGWESPAYWVLLILAILFRTGRVGFYESPLNTMRHRAGPIAWIRTAFFRSMHVVVTPGPAATASLNSMGVASSRIVEGFNAVNVKAFHQSAAKIQDRHDAAPEPGHSFLYAGQLISRKRVEAIVEAFRQVSRPEDKLTIVGTGDLEHELRELSSSEAGRIFFVPTVDNEEMPSIMAQHHTLVLASLTEVWGLVVNEALATGMHAVVSSNCGVAPSVAGMRGVYLTRADVSDLPAKMIKSREDWAGRITSPAILDFTPERFADRFVAAFHVARPKR